jgi:peptide/nickel transport system substrate-binding protein
MKKKIIAALAVTSVGALALAGCTAEQPEPEGVVRVAYGGLPESWGPGAEMEPGYMRVPYETLLSFDENGDVAPNLIASWELNEDGTELTAELQSGVTFHDGEAFDADAVVVNIEAVRDTPGPFSGPFQGVEVEAVDGDTVRFTFGDPTPSFTTLLAARNAPMISPAAIDSGAAQTEPVGTGPWMFDASASVGGSVAVFTSFEEYWGDRPAVASLELYGIGENAAITAGLLSGELDIADTEQSEFPAFEGTDIDTFSFPGIRNQIAFFDRGPGGAFELKEVRQAMCLAIDKDARVAIDPDAESRTHHFAEGNYGYNSDLTDYEFDLEAADELLASVGYPSVVSQISTAPFTNQQTTLYVDGMNQLENVNITINPLSPPEWQSSWNDGAVNGAGLGSNDELTPYDWYKSWFAADAAANVSGVESDELKDAADAAIAAGDTDEAEGLWQEVLAIIQDEALACGHMGGSEIIAYSTDRVANVEAPFTPYEQNSVNYRALTVVAPAEG